MYAPHILSHLRYKLQEHRLRKACLSERCFCQKTLSYVGFASLAGVRMCPFALPLVWHPALQFFQLPLSLQLPLGPLGLQLVQPPRLPH